jgi:hypothetical protein
LSITQNASTSYYGVSNLAIGANLVERLRQFITLLSGSHLWYLGDIIENFFPSVVFGLIVFGIIYLATRNHSPATKNTRLSPLNITLFPLFVIGLTILASIGTVSALWITHFAILMPWPALASFGSVDYSFRHFDALAGPGYRPWELVYFDQL